MANRCNRYSQRCDGVMDRFRAASLAAWDELAAAAGPAALALREGVRAIVA